MEYCLTPLGVDCIQNFLEVMRWPDCGIFLRNIRDAGKKGKKCEISVHYVSAVFKGTSVLTTYFQFSIYWCALEPSDQVSLASDTWQYKHCQKKSTSVEAKLFYTYLLMSKYVSKCNFFRFCMTGFKVFRLSSVHFIVEGKKSMYLAEVHS